MTYTRDKARAIGLATAFIRDGVAFRFAVIGGRYAFDDLTDQEQSLLNQSGAMGTAARKVIYDRLEEYALETEEEQEDSKFYGMGVLEIVEKLEEDEHGRTCQGSGADDEATCEAEDGHQEDLPPQAGEGDHHVAPGAHVGSDGGSAGERDHPGDAE